MSRNRSIWPFLCTTLLAGGGYLATLAPDLTWQHWGSDGGELITAAVTLGVPHPPGYPTYVLLGQLFHALPVGSIAFRFNLFSAVCTALAAGIVSAISYRHLSNESYFPNTNPRFPLTFSAVSTGLVFAFAPLVWSQAIIAEVYALNLLCVAALLWALAEKRPFLAGCCCGISLTTHLTSLLLLPLALAAAPRHRRQIFGGGLLLGLLPLLALPWLARSGSPVVWGDPGSLAGWWWLVSGRIYHPNAFALPQTKFWPRLQEWSTLLLTQFTFAGLPLLIFSLVRLHRTKPEWHRAGGLLATAVFITVYAFGYNTEDAAVLLLPVLLLLTLLLAPALTALRGAALLLPLALFLLNFPEQTLRHDLSLRLRAAHLLQTAAPDAILVTPGNATIFTLWYLQHVEAQRTDLILVDANLFAFDWYRARLARQHPDLQYLDVDDLPGFVQANGIKRAICYVDLELQRDQEASSCACSDFTYNCTHEPVSHLHHRLRRT